MHGHDASRVTRVIDAFLTGAGYYWRGQPLIFRRGVRSYAFVPILLALLVFAGFVWAGAWWLDELLLWTEARVPSWLDWLEWLAWPLFVAIAILVVVFGFVVVANLLAAPFNGTLSEVVEARLTGRAPPSLPWLTMMKRLPHTMVQETRKLLYYVLWAIPFLLLSCVFVVGAPLWFLFGAWMLALEFGDYPMDNHGVPFPEMRRRLRRRPWHALGFGSMTALAFLVPGLNLIAMPTAVAGATIFWIEELQDAVT